LVLPSPVPSSVLPYPPLFRSYGAGRACPAERRPDVGHGSAAVGRASPSALGLRPGRAATPERAPGATRDGREETGSRRPRAHPRSEEHTSELQSRVELVCRLL